MVTVTDKNNCQSTEYFQVYEPHDFEVVLTDDADCDGKNAVAEIRQKGVGTQYGNISDASLAGADVALDGNNDVVYTYAGYSAISWRGPNGYVTSAANQTKATGLESGTYTVVMSKPNVCAVTMNFTVSNVMELTYTTKPQTCAGIVDGEITVEVVGGSGNYEYTWEDVTGVGSVSSNGSHQVKLQAGTYNVTVKDVVSNCSKSISDITVGYDMDFNVEAAVSDISCYEMQDGTIDVTVMNGSGDYTYQWTGTGFGIEQGAEDQNGLARGQYTVVVTDNVLGCKFTRSNLVVNGPSSRLLASVTSHVDVNCNGGNDGTLTVKVSGGTPFDAIGTGMPYYKYKFIDAAGSSSSASVEKGVNDYQIEQTGLVAGNYHYEIQDKGGCTAVIDYAITEPEEMTLTYEVSPITVSEAEDGEIVLNVSGGNPSDGSPKYHVAWTDLTNSKDMSAYNNIFNLTHLAAGTYRAVVSEVTDNGCGTKSIDITVANTGLSFVAEATGNRCYNGNEGVIAVTIFNGKAPYTLSISGKTNSTMTGLTGRDIYYFRNLENDNYYITLTDADGTTYTQSKAVTNLGTELKVTLGERSISCFDADGSVAFAISGGNTAPNSTDYRYTVYLEGDNKTDSKVLSSISTPDDFKFTDIPAGTYRIHVIDDWAKPSVCEVYSPEFTFEQSTLKIDNVVATNITCPGSSDGTLTVEALGSDGISYTWYGLVYNDASKAAAEANGKSLKEMTEDMLAQITSATATPSTEFSSTTYYKKFNGATQTNVPAGYYFVNVVDQTHKPSCNIVSEVAAIDTIGVLRMELTPVTVTSCDATVANGQIIVRAEGGTAPYSLSLDGAKAITTTTGDYNFKNLLTGTHTVSLTDANGCSYTANPLATSVPIYEKVSLETESYVMDDSENGKGTAAFVIKGGVPSRVNDGGTPNDPTDDVSYYIYELTLAGTTSGTAISRHIDTEALGSSTGDVVVSYVDATDVSKGIKVEFSNLAADTYTASVRDASATSATCSASADFTLNKLQMTFEEKQPACKSLKDGQISVNVTGANGYVQYKWYHVLNSGAGDNLISTASIVTGLDAGTYKVVITDAENSTATADAAAHKKNSLEKQFVLSYDRTLTIVPSVVDETCYGANNGSISVVIQGADASKGMSYKWVGPSGFSSTEQNISNLKPGSYTLVITDGDGCQEVLTNSTEVSTTVGAASQIEFKLASEIVDCQDYKRVIKFTNLNNSAATDAERMMIRGGNHFGALTDGYNTGLYTYRWSGNSVVDAAGLFGTYQTSGVTLEEMFTTQNLTVGGTYTVTVTDQNGCEVTKSITLPDDIELTPTVVAATCNGAADGEISTLVSGVVNPQYQWYEQDNGSLCSIGDTQRDCQRLCISLHKDLRRHRDWSARQCAQGNSRQERCLGLQRSG